MEFSVGTGERSAFMKEAQCENEICDDRGRRGGVSGGGSERASNEIGCGRGASSGGTFAGGDRAVYVGRMFELPAGRWIPERTGKKAADSGSGDYRAGRARGLVEP